ncbi:MAG TPA: ABC transporter ATP-binding protein [Streptosporangiaceae bacterium]|nr:ABC transporter ATP-binding protein [Streptosporangiaceae bacterium]
MRVDAGDYVSLMGRSGSGKSTLLNLIGLLDKPTAGSVIFAGHDTRHLSDRAMSRLRARAIGFVFQAFNLLPHRSAEENVVLALLYQRVSSQSRIHMARNALERVGMLDRAHAFPAQLSGGEKQRVAIARAVAGRPTLVLCDEPTGNLDVPTARVVLDLLGSLRDDGLAVITVTHDPQVASRAGRHLIMDDGQVREIQAQPQFRPTA